MLVRSYILDYGLPIIFVILQAYGLATMISVDMVMESYQVK